MRILVTGATGFIGSHVTRRLVREGCEVVALVRSRDRIDRIDDVARSVTVMEADLLAAAPFTALHGQKFDACLHLAWYAEPGRYLTAPENLGHVAATMRLLEALPATGCRRFVGAGTCFELDLARAPSRLDETSPVGPHTLYGASKLAVATVLPRWAALAKMTWAWGRIFYPYGPGDDHRKLVPMLLRELAAGRPVPLGSGQQVRDYIHVEDVAAAFWVMMRWSSDGVVNVGTGDPVRVADVAHAAADLFGRRDLLRFGEYPTRPDDPAQVCADSTLVRSLGWAPRYGLADGLAATLKGEP